MTEVTRPLGRRAGRSPATDRLLPLVHHELQQVAAHEQAAGGPDVDTRSDVDSLGVTRTPSSRHP